MRAIHFCFQLHEPYKLREFSGGEYFEAEAEFQELNQRVYQPFFALLERNTQRYRQLHFSLMVSGVWLELAEKYDAELVRRLKKLVELKQIELIVEPYYHSWAIFYNEKEFLEQVELMEKKLTESLRAEGRILALPGMVYADGIAKWAEEVGFVGMLAGGLPAVLKWHSPNHVYEAAGCKYLRVLFNNQHLTSLLLQQDEQILSEEKVEQDGVAMQRVVLDAEKFQRAVELDGLRGELINLYFDVQALWQLNEVGIVGFFDRLFASWLQNPGHRFLNAGEAMTFEAPEAEVSVTEAAGWQAEFWQKPTKKAQIPEILQGPKEESAQVGRDAEARLPVLYEKSEVAMPGWLDTGVRKKANEQLYAVRREILASEDEQLIRDFRVLTGAEYTFGLDQRGLRNWERLVGDLRRRANEAKKSQAVEISRAYTKRHDRGEVESVTVHVGMQAKAGASTNAAAEAVKVNFAGGRVAGVSGASVHAAQKVAEPAADDETMVIVRRLPNLTKHETGAAPRRETRANEVQRGTGAESVKATEPMKSTRPAKPMKSTKPKGLKRVIRKLVIE